MRFKKEFEYLSRELDQSREDIYYSVEPAERDEGLRNNKCLPYSGLSLISRSIFKEHYRALWWSSVYDIKTLHPPLPIYMHTNHTNQKYVLTLCSRTRILPSSTIRVLLVGLCI
jgi:hypothetical protein